MKPATPVRWKEAPLEPPSRSNAKYPRAGGLRFRIVRPDLGVVASIDVRPTVEEAKRRLSDNLRFLATDIEKDMREAEYGARRVLEPGVDALKLDGTGTKG